jgi:hypothetical protein
MLSMGTSGGGRCICPSLVDSLKVSKLKLEGSISNSNIKNLKYLRN